MNKRSNKLLMNLVLGKKENLYTLMEMYNVQDRSIRIDVKELNRDLKKAKLPVILVEGNGDLVFDTKDPINLDAFKQFFGTYDIYTYALSTKERSTVLTMILLNSEGYVTVESLCEKVDASRNTVLNDLSMLKDWFKEHNMQLTSKVRRGYQVVASERKIREWVLKILQINGNTTHMDIFWNLLLGIVDVYGVYPDVCDILVNVEHKRESYLSDYSFAETALECTIALNHIRKGRILDEPGDERIKKSTRYEFACCVYRQAEKKYSIHIPQREILYFADRLSVKSYLEDKVQKRQTMEIRLMISEAIYHVSETFKIDFYHDFSIYDMIISHIRAAIFRMKNDEVLTNPLKNSLLKDYPEYFAVIKENLKTLEQFIGKEFSEDEISFIVLYFASVTEKEKAINEKKRKIRVALVCATGRGTAQYMMAKLRILDDVIDIVSVTASHNVQQIEQNKAEMIISTIPLHYSVLPSVIVESPMLTKNDIVSIQRMALEIRDGYSEPEDIRYEEQKEDSRVNGDFLHLLNTQRIQLNVEAEDWQAAIRQAGNLLVNTKAVEPKYVEAMINSVKKNGPYIVVCPQTALPHANPEDGVLQEAVSIVRLKKPIDFHSGVNDPVSFIVAMSILSAQSINAAIYDMMLIFGNDKHRQHLMQFQDETEVYNYIESLEKL